MSDDTKPQPGGITYWVNGRPFKELAEAEAANSLTEQQMTALHCAHADLLGALQCKDEPWNHDWKAHQLTLDDLRDAFPFLDTEGEPE
jgi:hypothetical protein